MSVFDGPITDEKATNSGDDNQMPPNLASVFMPLTSTERSNQLETDLHTNLISPNEINFSENNSDEEDNNQKSPEARKKTSRESTVNNDDEEDETPMNYMKNFNKTSSTTPNSILKTSRYFSYRNSLTNRYNLTSDDIFNF